MDPVSGFSPSVFKVSDKSHWYFAPSVQWYQDIFLEPAFCSAMHTWDNAFHRWQEASQEYEYGKRRSGAFYQWGLRCPIIRPRFGNVQNQITKLNSLPPICLYLQQSSYGPIKMVDIQQNISNPSVEYEWNLQVAWNKEAGGVGEMDRGCKRLSLPWTLWRICSCTS